MPSRRALAPGVVLLLLLGLSGPALAAGPYPPPSAGSASVTPSRIKAGQCTTFSGDGFAAGAAVAVADDGVSAGSTAADRRGAFRLRLCYGTSARTGQHVISGSGQSPRATAMTVSAVLTITGVEQSGGTGNGNGGSSIGSTGGQAASGATGGPVQGVSAPQAVSGADLPPAPRTGSAAAPRVPAPGASSLAGLAGPAVVLALLLALVAACWLLLLLGRRRRRERDAVVPVVT